jgi:hypothetical protein
MESIFPTVRNGSIFNASSLDLQFARTKTLDPRVTFTRASSGTYVGSDGLIKTATTNEPRFDHNPTTGESLGLLVEEQRTNSIRNNTMVGAVAGTPGTLPTNWSASLAGGLSREVLSIGQANGINYIDLRVFGTTTNANLALNLTFEPVSGAASASGQAWAESVYLSIVGGSLSGVANTRLYLSSTNGTSELAYYNLGDMALTSALTRFSGTASPATAGMTAVRPMLWVQHSGIGSAIDITLRIGLPQLEQGAFATSVIPTTTATVTRSADVASISGSNFSSWYRQDEGTVFASTRLAISPNLANSSIIGIGDGTNSNRVQLGASTSSSGNINGVVTAGGVFQAQPLVGSITNTGPHRVAFGYATNSVQVGVNSLLGTEDTSATMPSTATSAYLANGANPNSQSSMTFARLTYWPQRLPNSTLQEVTR